MKVTFTTKMDVNELDLLNYVRDCEADDLDIWHEDYSILLDEEISEVFDPICGSKIADCIKQTTRRDEVWYTVDNSGFCITIAQIRDATCTVFV